MGESNSRVHRTIAIKEAVNRSASLEGSRQTLPNVNELVAHAGLIVILVGDGFGVVSKAKVKLQPRLGVLQKGLVTGAFGNFFRGPDGGEIIGIVGPPEVVQPDAACLFLLLASS